MKDIVFHIPNIHCMHCAHTIKMELGEFPGVNQVDVDIESKNVRISYETPATAEGIENLLADINYPVQK